MRSPDSFRLQCHYYEGVRPWGQPVFSSCHSCGLRPPHGPSLLPAHWPLSQIWRSALAWFQFNLSEWILLSHLTHSPWGRESEYTISESLETFRYNVLFDENCQYFRRTWICVAVNSGSPFFIPLTRRTSTAVFWPKSCDTLDKAPVRRCCSSTQDG